MMLAKIFTAALITTMASGAAAQEVAAPSQTPRGTYFIYGEDNGAVFVSHEPGLATADRWPLTFFYYRDGAFAGAARMAGIANCAQSSVSATLTDLLAEDGSASPPPSGETMPVFTFAQASGSGGEAIASFVCGDTEARLALSSAPIHGTPAITARNYIALRGLGIGERLSRDLAIRDPGGNDALVNTAVPEGLRDVVHAILRGER